MLAGLWKHGQLDYCQSFSVSLGWGLRTCISNKRPCEVDADGQDHTLKITVAGVFPLPIQFPLKSHRPLLLPTAPKLEWKILFMHVYYLFSENENTFCSNSNTALTKQDSPHFSCFSPSTHPPLSFQSVSTSVLHTDGQDCVYVYTSPALLVYMYTFVFFLSPH